MHGSRGSWGSPGPPRGSPAESGTTLGSPHIQFKMNKNRSPTERARLPWQSTDAEERVLPPGEAGCEACRRAGWLGVLSSAGCWLAGPAWLPGHEGRGQLWVWPGSGKLRAARLSPRAVPLPSPHSLSEQRVLVRERRLPSEFTVLPGRAVQTASCRGAHSQLQRARRRGRAPAAAHLPVP